LCVAKGDLAQASSQFNIVLGEDKNNVAALLDQACVEFDARENEDQYQKAVESYKRSLDYYKKALRAYPSCPGAARLGIGYCRYRLGQFDKARQAFHRVLDLDPENIDALVALGIMELQTNEVDGIQKGMLKMQRAFEIYPYCSMALNHLANHFFFTGQHFLVEQLTETALSVINHGLMRAHSYYNLARSYHSKGDFEKAGRYYMASVKEINKPQEFALPFYGLGQVQLKLGDFRNALSNFEKVMEVYPESCETLKAFMELGELLMLMDPGAALDSLKSALNILKKGGEEVPIELLNNIGVLYFEKGEFELAENTFKEALGEVTYLSLLFDRKKWLYHGFVHTIFLFRDMTLFHQLEEDGISLDLPWDKVTTLFNYARLLEQLRNNDKASVIYRLILFKYPDYVDAYLRLAAICKERNNIQLSIVLIRDALKIDDKCPNALSMLGDLELKIDDWLKAKDTFRAAKDATDGKDSYATLSLGNWNYYAAMRSERRDQKLEATHFEKAKELYTKKGVKVAANGKKVSKEQSGKLERRKQEDELKRVMQQEEHFERIKKYSLPFHRNVVGKCFDTKTQKHNRRVRL
ncbi:hypothetical protein HPP92_007226, partial [Vanilla planifolia]